MVTSLQFILFYTIFLFFIIQLSAMAGQSLVSGVNAPTAPSPPTTPARGGFWGFWDGIFGIIGYLFTNIVYFFQLMGSSSSFTVFGAIILAPFMIALVWIVLQLIRGQGS
jgi:hypothetical protein